MSHIHFLQLFNYLANRLFEEQNRREIELHLSNCAFCRTELAMLRQAVGETPAIDQPEPSPELIRQTVAAFRHVQQRAQDRSRQPAILHFDSYSSGLQAGVRGGLTDHQLLYSIEPYDMDLQIVKDPANQQFVLRGQILGHEPAMDALEGIELRLKNQHGFDSRGLTDALGQFRFSNLVEGIYSLELVLDRVDIVLEKLIIDHG